MTLASDKAFENVIENAVVGAAMFVEIKWISSSDQEKFLIWNDSEYLSFRNSCYFQIMEVNCDCTYFSRMSILNIWPNLTMLNDSKVTVENLIFFKKNSFM